VVVGEGQADSEYKAFYRKFVDAFVDSASKIRVGYGLDESVQMGPLQNKGRKERVLGFIEKGLEEGATLRLDGRNVRLVGDWPHTCFLNPTVFEDVEPDMVIGKEEIFGPVAGIMKARSLEEALEMIHGNPYGNAAAIFTSRGKWAREFQYRVQCGAFFPHKPKFM
jgi:malonate-semialdehyde dehydrogenase (acetylating)/methylmalonate-semialdehyde dehydrogenase